MEGQSSKSVTSLGPVTIKMKQQEKVGEFQLDKNILPNWTEWREKCLEEMKLYEEISNLEESEEKSLGDIQEINLHGADGVDGCGNAKKKDDEKKFTCEILLTGVGYSRFLEVAELAGCAALSESSILKKYTES